MLTWKQYQAKFNKRKKKSTGKRKRKAVKRSGGAHSLFKIAARDAGYKAAKRAKVKADSRAKKAWKKAQVKAKKKLKKMLYC